MSWQDHREALVCAGNTRLLRSFVLLTVSAWACQVNLHAPHGSDDGGSGGSQQSTGGTWATCGGEGGAGGSVLNGGASGAVEAGAPPQPDAGESSAGGSDGGIGGAAHAGAAGEAHGGATDGGASGLGHGGVAGETGDPTCGHSVIEVTSLIDGLDRLSIASELLWFDHLTQAGPGLESFRTESTRVDVSIGETTESVAWCPIWENDCNTCDGSCGELRAGPVRSRPLCGEYFPGSISNLTFSCTGAEERPGASCTLTQEPSEANGQLAIVTFDDDLAGGPTYYTARLEFDYGPDASGECDGGSPPESCDPHLTANRAISSVSSK